MYKKLTVADLKAELESRGLETTGKKAELVERLEAADDTNGAPAPKAMDAPADMTVAALKEELASLGEAVSGAKAALVARLIAARGGAPPAKKIKVDGGSSANAAWFWAANVAGSTDKREWMAYPPDVTAAVEAAYAAAKPEHPISKTHVVVFSPGATGLFSQKRLDNAQLVRPVARTTDGSAPSRAPPNASSAPGAKSTGGAASAPVPPPPAAAAAAGGPTAVAASKSVKAGGVQQVRYAVTAGTKSSGGGGLKTEVVKGRAAVDPSCPRADDTHIYDEGKDVYDALLNQTDIGANKNKYYVIQMLETDGTPNQWYVWNKWGRVGEERGSQNALRGPMSKEAAKQDFCKKFGDKTKNEWSRREQFQTVPGKYTLIERDYGDADPPAPAPAPSAGGAGSSAELKPAVSKLDKRVQDFVSQIADIKMMEHHMREIGFDPAKMPLGKLKKSSVMQGYKVLQELSTLIVGGGAISGGGSSSGGGASSNGGGVVAGGSARVLELSNQFYSIIPHTSDGSRGTRTVLPSINTPTLLKEKIEMVEALGEIELASRVIDTKQAAFDMHPIDARYNQLHINLTPIDIGSDLHKMLATYLTQTHASTHSTYTLELEQAFEVEREGEKGTFDPTIGNRQLLWHGSRLTNWCGILSTGLRIAPPEAPVTGYMFGKGVYFANMSSKSANYCFASSAAPRGVMLLCDVALGKQYERLASEYEADKSCRKAKADSTWGKGKTAPDKTGYQKLPGSPEVTVPMGTGKASGVGGSSLLYDEFIVYDTSQIRQKYVLQVKFHFKSHMGW